MERVSLNVKAGLRYTRNQITHLLHFSTKLEGKKLVSNNQQWQRYGDRTVKQYG